MNYRQKKAERRTMRAREKARFKRRLRHIVTYLRGKRRTTEQALGLTRFLREHT